MEAKTLVLGVIGADVHAVGNKILEIAFTEAGFNVVNLGVLVSQKEFVEAALETDADAIMVSSLYGHGEIDVRGLREALIEAGIGDILMYIGGYLVVEIRIGQKSRPNSKNWDLIWSILQVHCQKMSFPLCGKISVCNWGFL